MNSKEVSEKYEIEEERIGVVGKAAKMTSDNDNRYLCSMRVDVANHIQDVEDASDEYKFAIVASLFKKFFKSHFHPSHLDECDPKFWLMVELPKGFFREEVQLGIEGSEQDGIYFSITDEEAKGLSKFVPVVNISEEEDE